MDDPVDKPERRSGTYYFPGAFRYLVIYAYTTSLVSQLEQKDSPGWRQLGKNLFIISQSATMLDQ